MIYNNFIKSDCSLTNVVDILSDVNISGNLNLGSSDGSIMKFVDNVHSSGYCGNIIFKFNPKNSSVPTFVVSKEGGKNANMPGHILLTEFTLLTNNVYFDTGEGASSSINGFYETFKSFENKVSIHTDKITIPANYDTEFYYDGQRFTMCYDGEFCSPRIEFFQKILIDKEDCSGYRVTELLLKKVEIDYGFHYQQCDRDALIGGRLVLKPTPSDVEREIYLVYQC